MSVNASAVCHRRAGSAFITVLGCLRYGDLQKAESAGPKIPPASPKDQRLLSIAILDTQQHQGILTATERPIS